MSTKLTKADEKPTMEWLRLAPAMQRVLLIAWTADSVVFRGGDLNAAHRLQRRGLLRSIHSSDGGLSREFSLTNDARAYPPAGLKALVVRRKGRRVVDRPARPARSGEEADRG